MYNQEELRQIEQAFRIETGKELNKEIEKNFSGTLKDITSSSESTITRGTSSSLVHADNARVDATSKTAHNLIRFFIVNLQYFKLQKTLYFMAMHNSYYFLLFLSKIVLN